MTFVPYYFGKSQRLYEKEGIDLELIVMRPPIGVRRRYRRERSDYSAAGGLSVRAAMKGLPLRTIMLFRTRLSFSLIGQPEMVPAKIKNVAVSGIGSLAHHAGYHLMKRLGNEEVAYISTNTTGNSYTAFAAERHGCRDPHPALTSMATLAGYEDLWKHFRRARSAGRFGGENISHSGSSPASKVHDSRHTSEHGYHCKKRGRSRTLSAKRF